MKLYSRPLSPYSARVRVALYVKEVAFDHEVVEMGWSKNADFLKVNPLARIPVLELDDGTRLVESSAIVEYIDEAFPSAPRLRSPDLVTRATQRALAQIVEHEVLKPMMDVFMDADQKRDVSASRARLDTGLTNAERLLTDNLIRTTIVDAILLPTRFSLGNLERFAQPARPVGALPANPVLRANGPRDPGARPRVAGDGGGPERLHDLASDPAVKDAIDRPGAPN
jgi:glutathione S-transferase